MKIATEVFQWSLMISGTAGLMVIGGIFASWFAVETLVLFVSMGY